MRSHDEQRLAYRIHCENLRSTLLRLLDTDFEIILDTVLRDEVELQACLDVLSTRPLYLVGVRAPLSILERRELNREDRATGMAREQFEHPAFIRRYDLKVDTSICTPQEGASVIRRFLENDHRV
jgi:chloramphenicol 3-O phosphotransferase